MWNFCTVPRAFEAHSYMEFCSLKSPPIWTGQIIMGYGFPHNMTVSLDLLCMTIVNFMPHLMKFFVALSILRSRFSCLFPSPFAASSILRCSWSVHVFVFVFAFFFILPSAIFDVIIWILYTYDFNQCYGFWFSFRFVSVHLYIQSNNKTFTKFGVVIKSMSVKIMMLTFRPYEELQWIKCGSLGASMCSMRWEIPEHWTLHN